ncbi:MAG TPA: sortase, partial [Propionibacteriaceae bacterium]|nr:sortase [Propionibacteriaceae bacterium]
MTAEDSMPHAGPADGGSAQDGHSAAGKQPPTRRRRPGILMVTGLLLLATGLGTLGWIGYEYFGTNGPSQDAARTEVSQLEQEWNASTAPDSSAPSTSASPSATSSATATASSGPMYTQAQLDKAMAILTIPRFGPDYKVPIIVGTSDYALARGVGWYQTTQQPGQIGNFAIAGHR